MRRWCYEFGKVFQVRDVLIQDRRIIIKEVFVLRLSPPGDIE